MQETNEPPQWSTGHDADAQARSALELADSAPPPAGNIRPDPRYMILRQTLSIMTAEVEEQLIARTLAAACEVTGAAVAAVLDPDGAIHTHGDAELCERLAVTPPAVRRRLRRRVGGLTNALSGTGLPAAITAALGDVVLIVADPAPDRMGPEGGCIVSLLVAHAQASLDRLRQFDQLCHRANCDPLTGLRHHRPFEERLADTAPGRTAVIAIDVDGFKKINDVYGHQAGDEALLALVGALRAALRDQDELYRIGGDEFAAVIDVKGPAEVATIAHRLIDAAHGAHQTVSVGAALRLEGETGRETLRRADEALYEAKRSGRDTARVAA